MDISRNIWYGMIQSKKVEGKSTKKRGLIVISFIILFIIIICIAMNQKKVITDIEEYGFNGFKGYSNLDVFPESIPDDGTDAQYYFEYKDGIFDPYYQIYLKCTYDTPTYSDEVKRLAQIKEDYQGTTQKIRYNTEDFEYPAYVSIYGDDGCYEYALLDEGNQTIIYIFTQWAKADNIKFENAYLPNNFMLESEHAFSIYMFDLGDGGRYVVDNKYNSK
ncbi:hypothetical protein LAD12857_05020 [Lacrimispora amygdalina]|uniref:DUF4825 domain-containing protein n=3 Tax=Lacrimispora amygdalina TaxID=253257 RepID=A0ABQ5M1U2_9FIRM